MKLPRLVLRNLRRRPLATVLTTLSVALGVGLFAAVGAMRQAAQEGFLRSASVCDVIVGAKGSPLQLTLNTLYHLGLSPGNVPFAAYEELAAHPGAAWAVPTAVGDSYRGHRIVATTDALFSELELRGAGPLRFAAGGPWRFGHDELLAAHAGLRAELAEGHGPHDGHDHGSSDPSWQRAVLGAAVARETGLAVGDRLVPVHDVQDSPTAERHEEAELEVCGVLAPTGTPFDRAIWIPLGAFYSVAGHRADDATATGGARDPLGLSAVLVRTDARRGMHALRLWRDFNDRLDTQAARPAAEVQNLFRIVGGIDQLMRVIAALVVAVALVGVMVAISNTMGARRREFAVLRALGAGRRALLTLVVLESAAISLAGGLLGLALAGGGVWLGAGALEAQTGVSVSALPGGPEGILLLATTAVGALAGLVPALAAYRTEAARWL